MRAAVVLLAVAGCGPSAPVQVADPRAAMDAASTTYAQCVDRATAALDPAADQPAVLAARALKSCTAERAAVAAEIARYRVAGGMDAAAAAQVAERSVRVADSELRDRANAAIVTRKLTVGG